MTYQRLAIDGPIPLRVRYRIDRVEDIFREVHTMLRLPVPEADLKEGCNFAIELALFAVVGGISSAIYPGACIKGDGNRFKKLLVEWYPWDLDPPQGLPSNEVASVLYHAFRNPIVHTLGTVLPLRKSNRKPYARTVKIETFSDNSESRLENIERSSTYPDYMGPSTRYRIMDDTLLLLLDGFYWGLRKMFERLCGDSSIMNLAEKQITQETDRLRNAGIV